MRADRFQIRIPKTVIFVFLFCFLLASCAGVDSDVAIDFYPREKWSATLQIKFPKSSIGPSSNRSDFDRQINNLIAKARDFGVYSDLNVSESERDITYSIEMRGVGLSSLNQVMFDGGAEINSYIDNGQTIIDLTQPIKSNLGFEAFSLALGGSKIISGNGKLVDNHTMSWDNPRDPIKVVLAPYSGMNFANADITIDFYKSERWSANLDVTIPNSSLGWAIDENEIERAITEYADKSSALGIATSMHKNSEEGQQNYSLRFDGVGHNILSQSLFADNAVIEHFADEGSDKKLIHFLLLGDSDLGFNSYTLTLRGGQIGESNGELVDDHTVTWINPNGWLEAKLSEHSSFSLVDAQLTIDFLTGKKWRAVYYISLPVPPTGTDAENIYNELEIEINEFMSEISASDVDISRINDKDMQGSGYQLQIQGKGFETLNQSIFSGNAWITSEDKGLNREIQFSYSGGPTRDFRSFQLTLRGGTISSGNGNIIDGKSITWNESSPTIRATLTERFYPSLAGLKDILGRFLIAFSPIVNGFIILIISASVLASVYLLWKRVASLEPLICKNCGYQFPKEARFCPNCSHRRQSGLRIFYQELITRTQRSIVSVDLPKIFTLVVNAIFSSLSKVIDKTNNAIRSLFNGMGSSIHMRRTPSQRKIPSRKMTSSDLAPIDIHPASPRIAGRAYIGDKGKFGTPRLLPNKNKILIGSGIYCDIRLDDSMVAPKHVAIYSVRSHYIVEKISPEFEFYINDNLGETSNRLHSGDVLRLGDTVILLELDE